MRLSPLLLFWQSILVITIRNSISFQVARKPTGVITSNYLLSTLILVSLLNLLRLKYIFHINTRKLARIATIKNM